LIAALAGCGAALLGFLQLFPAARLADARAWERTAEDDPGSFEEIDGLPGDVVALRAIGIVTAQHHRETLIPLVGEKLKTHDKIKCLIVLSEDYTALSGDAVWSDAKFDAGHVWDFSRIAIVTDIGWITRAARLVMPLVPFPSKPSRLPSWKKPRNGSCAELAQRSVRHSYLSVFRGGGKRRFGFGRREMATEQLLRRQDRTARSRRQLASASMSGKW
jgi:hypothetical protein